MNADLARTVRAVARRAGLDAVGFASADPFTSTRIELERRRADGSHGGMQFTFRNPARSTTPAATVPGARSLVVGARSYRRPGAEPPAEPSGEVARYARSDDYTALRRSLGEVAAALRDAGWRAAVVVDDNALVDREAAVRAGLGWYGKNANVLLPGRGSWFVLGSVITDAPLPPDAPVDDGCGPCARCLGACPTGALTAPGVLDARRCLAWLLQAEGVFPREHRVALGHRIYGCDDCQDVCPANARLPAPAVDGLEEEEEQWVPLLDLLDASDADLLERHGRWYIARREPRHLRRNALVVLGNIGDGRDPRTRRVLTGALAHDDPIVRAHAVWAAARLGCGVLLGDLAADERDPAVRTELDDLPLRR